MQLYAPDVAMEWMEAWSPALELHPGFYLLGDDGGREMYCIDLSNPGNQVMSADIVSSGWDDTESLGLSVIEFIDSIDNGTFDPLAEG